MIVAVVNLPPGVGRTVLAVNLAGELALRGRPVTLLDTDRRSGALEWALFRRRNGLPALFPTLGITDTQLCGGLSRLCADLDHVIIDTPARSPSAVRAALRAADTVLLPTRPTRTALGDAVPTMQLVVEALAEEPAKTALLVPARAPEGVVIEPGEEVTVCGLRLPVATSVLGERMSFALSRDTGLLVQELDMVGPAEVDIRALVGEVFGTGSSG